MKTKKGNEIKKGGFIDLKIRKWSRILWICGLQLYKKSFLTNPQIQKTKKLTIKPKYDIIQTCKGVYEILFPNEIKFRC